MLKLNENFKITQILPDTFYEDVKLKDGICLKIEKKKTKNLVDLLKEFQLNNEKVYLKSDSSSQLYSEREFSYSYGKNRINLSTHEIYDISFLKRVKPLDNNHNRLLINFSEVILKLKSAFRLYGFSTRK
jgi:hypothetical protein